MCVPIQSFDHLPTCKPPPPTPFCCWRNDAPQPRCAAAGPPIRWSVRLGSAVAPWPARPFRGAKWEAAPVMSFPRDLTHTTCLPWTKLFCNDRARHSRQKIFPLPSIYVHVNENIYILIWPFLRHLMNTSHSAIEERHCGYKKGASLSAGTNEGHHKALPSKEESTPWLFRLCCHLPIMLS